MDGVNGLFELDELEDLWRGGGMGREGESVYVCFNSSQWADGGLCVYVHESSV